MRKTFLAFALFANSLAAYGDAIKPATVDLTCTNPVDNRVIYIVSGASGSRLLVNTEIKFEGAQLIAGTEGGPAYMQAVGGGYNITIEGGDFDKAFENSSTIENGSAAARIWSADTGVTVGGICQGRFSFENLGN